MQKPTDQVVVLTMQSPEPYHPDHPSPPKPPRPTLTRLPVSKPKSRFLELNYPPHPLSSDLPRPQPQPLHSSSSDSDSDSDEDDEDDTHPISDKFHPHNTRLIGPRALTESIALIAITSLLVATLTIPSLKPHEIWNLHLWKWAVMLLVVFCGRLVSNWLVWIAVFLLERHFPLKEKVLYFVFGLRKSVRSCVWLGLVLLSWSLLFDGKRVKNSSALHKVSRALIAVVIAATIWMLKIFLVKVLASSFHVATFFDRMKESVFHHYILETLSGEPIGEEEMKGIKEKDRRRRFEEELDRRRRRLERTKTDVGVNTGRTGSRRIDMDRLRKLSTVSATACSVRRLVSHVMRTGLSTVSRTADRVANRFGEPEEDIRSEWEARTSAERVFKNVARSGNK